MAEEDAVASGEEVEEDECVDNTSVRKSLILTNGTEEDNEVSQTLHSENGMDVARIL